MEYLALIGTVTIIHLLAVISPGPDFIMACRNSLTYSRKTGIYTAVGFGIGIAVHIFYSLAGLALIISKSILLFNTIKFLGAGYLIYIGLKSVLSKSSKIELGEHDKKEDITHITKACMSPDGKTLYVTTNYTNRKNKPKGDFKETNFHIETAEYVNGLGWTNFKVLPFCKPQYSYAHASLSPDGNTLYFTANIRGGKESTKGTSDIFKVDVLGENAYSEPKNLGSQVNSYSGEMFPFMSYDNTLYFASNRSNGVGGFDIYKSVMNEKGIFEKAEVLPQPINSKQDDFCFVMEKNGTSGYFSSKRDGGKGEDDIYYFMIN